MVLNSAREYRWTSETNTGQMKCAGVIVQYRVSGLYRCVYVSSGECTPLGSLAS